MANEGILMRHIHPPTSAKVDISVSNNESFNEAFQFDNATNTLWDFNNKTFAMAIKGNFEQAALITLVSGSQITVDDAVLRILHFNVADTALNAVLVPGKFVYDLIMTDADSVKTQLMHGDFNFAIGVTGE